ncbi:unnamed protein product [Lymnaea stagnalis]|uniref:Uncharacterized protein n=1 Tax=Lymnaea stagnalis TaxID=6523 RepID=A0AAV2HSA3_LYMST
MLLPYNMQVSSWLSMICCLLLSATLVPPVGAPPSVLQCPLIATIEGTEESPTERPCLELMICDDNVEMWRFSAFTTPQFTAVADMPAKPPEKVGADFIDVEAHGSVSTKLELLWSLPPMTFDAQGFTIISRSYTNGSVTTACRLLKISPNITDTYADVMFRFPMTPVVPGADYSIAVFSNPLPPLMPPETSKDWMILKIRNIFKSEEPLSSNWRPNLLVQRLVTPGELKIQFSIRPEFRSYEIATLNTETNEQRYIVHDVASVNESQTFVLMTRLFKGTYQVMVRLNSNAKMCVCFGEEGNCSESCPETFTMNFFINEEEPPLKTTILQNTGISIQRTSTLDMITTTIPEEVLTPEATRPQEDFVLTTTTNDPLNMVPSTIQRTNNSLIGGLIGGLVAAGLFSFIVVVFAVLDKPPPPRKSKVSTN